MGQGRGKVGQRGKHRRGKSEGGFGGMGGRHSVGLALGKVDPWRVVGDGHHGHGREETLAARRASVRLLTHTHTHLQTYMLAMSSTLKAIIATVGMSSCDRITRDNRRHHHHSRHGSGDGGNSG